MLNLLAITFLYILLIFLSSKDVFGKHRIVLVFQDKIITLQKSRT